MSNVFSFLFTTPTNSRVMRKIEQTLKIEERMPLTGHNEEKIKNDLLEVQRLLSPLKAPGPPRHNATIAFSPEEGMPSSLPYPTFC